MFLFAAASAVAAVIAIKLFVDTVSFERDWEPSLISSISGRWCVFTQHGDIAAEYDIALRGENLLFDFHSHTDLRSDFLSRAARTFRINNRSFFMWEGSTYRATQVIYDPLTPYRMSWKGYEKDLGENVWIADDDINLDFERCDD